jgi:putative NADH-flavin reductase
MSTHITVLPASTKVGKETIRLLLASPASLTIRGIYRDASKAPDEYTSHPNFSSVKGDVASEESLDFGNSDAVLYVPPPTYENIDQSEWAKKTANNVKGALKKSGVKRLVVLSGLGSQNDHGIVSKRGQVVIRVDADDVGLCPPESSHRQDSQRLCA